jgi:PAS domain S-box-containing protein
MSEVRDLRDERTPVASPSVGALCAALEYLGLGVARLSLDGAWFAVSQSLCDMVSYSSEEMLALSFEEFFESYETHLECEDRDQLLSGRILSYGRNRCATTREGRRISLRSAVSLVCDELTNEPRSLLVILEDVTALKNAECALEDSEFARKELSRRMMNAQDIDRSRIARELHDDIGQSLAVLKIQLLRAARPGTARFLSPHPSIGDLAAKVQTIAEKVSRLSHQLHSSELEFLGLGIAVKSYCREFSQEFYIPIECSCDEHLENLEDVLALAFLRVVQEALGNVVKHSRAGSARIDLTATGEELILAISDDGVGFELDQSRLTAGLGLISMRERMHLIGGELEISSSPGKGTRIRAHAAIVRKRA